MIKSGLAELAYWQSSVHEMTLVRKSLELISESNKRDVKKEILRLAVRILLVLISRSNETKPAYEHMEFPDGYFVLYPVNLQALRLNAENHWRSMTINEWVAWIAGHWGIEAHMHVALRKLRSQSLDTLHIIPTDRGLVVKAMPEPTYTNPRFVQAIQILQDLGAVERTSVARYVSITSLGEDLRRHSLD
jgi:hypothetical protein